MERLERVWEAAKLSRRQREVSELYLAGLEAPEIAERLGIAEATVHVHAHEARKKLQAAQVRHEEREFYAFLLHELVPGPIPSNPPTPLYRETRAGEGELVRLHGGPVVTVEGSAGGTALGLGLRRTDTRSIPAGRSSRLTWRAKSSSNGETTFSWATAAK